MEIKIFTTGGTIDDIDYDSPEKAPKNHRTIIPRLLEQGRIMVNYSLEELMAKDSKFITDGDRDLMSKKCRECREDWIILTHGTMTMSDTAKYLGVQNIPKTIVLVGSLVLPGEGNSDALFNLGSAVASVQILPKGVYIVMNGKVFVWNNVRKDQEKGTFEEEN